MVTNLFVKEKVLTRLGLLTLAAGYSFNLSGWMMRWVEAGDAEGWKDGINGVWRYFPLDNLYPLTLGFCAGAAITTLIIMLKSHKASMLILIALMNRSIRLIKAAYRQQIAGDPR